jgi:hypothetical protein
MEMPEHIRRALAAEVAKRKPIPLADQIFANALNFHESAQRCFENRDEGDGRVSFPVIPGIVGLAFASELYMKALQVIESGKSRAAHGHRLNVLFAGLSEGTQTTIAERYGERRKGLNLDLRVDLLAFANAFVDFRYVYEASTNSVDVVGLGQLASALYEAALMLRPDLQAAPYAHGRLTAPGQGLPIFKDGGSVHPVSTRSG